MNSSLSLFHYLHIKYVNFRLTYSIYIVLYLLLIKYVYRTKTARKTLITKYLLKIIIISHGEWSRINNILWLVSASQSFITILKYDKFILRQPDTTSMEILRVFSFLRNIKAYILWFKSYLFYLTVKVT